MAINRLDLIAVMAVVAAFSLACGSGSSPPSVSPQPSIPEPASETPQAPAPDPSPEEVVNAFDAALGAGQDITPFAICCDDAPAGAALGPCPRELFTRVGPSITGNRLPTSSPGWFYESPKYTWRYEAVGERQVNVLTPVPEGEMGDPVDRSATLVHTDVGWRLLIMVEHPPPGLNFPPTPKFVNDFHDSTISDPEGMARFRTCQGEPAKAATPTPAAGASGGHSLAGCVAANQTALDAWNKRVDEQNADIRRYDGPANSGDEHAQKEWSRAYFNGNWAKAMVLFHQLTLATAQDAMSYADYYAEARRSPDADVGRAKKNLDLALERLKGHDHDQFAVAQGKQDPWVTRNGHVDRPTVDFTREFALTEAAHFACQ